MRQTLRVFPSYVLINKEAACWAAFLLGEDFEPFFSGRLGQPLIETGKQEIFGQLFAYQNG